MSFRVGDLTDQEQDQSCCALCGVTIVTGAGRSRQTICLICRAAVLDRVFQARRRRASVAARTEGVLPFRLRWVT